MKKYSTIFLFVCTGCVAAPDVYAESASVQTRNGNEFGLTFSSYSYQEPTLGVSIIGDKFGLSHTGTRVVQNDWFFKDDLHFAYGKVDYSGSGVQLGRPDWYYEARGLLGKDFQLGYAVYSPYAGLGYRYLFNDERGYSNTGSVGYRRESHYLYLPLGVTQHLKLPDQAVLSTTVEFDYFLRGEQVSRLSDLNGQNGFISAFDSTNRQNSGYGYRLNMLYEMSDWSFGPFLSVWKIASSEYTTQIMTDVTHGARLLSLHEPQNQTAEFGIRVSLRF